METMARRRLRHAALAAAAAVVVLAPACSYELRELTPELPENAQSSVLYAADGAEIVTLHAEENRTDLTLAQIPVSLQQAVIAIEDERFYLHRGVDFRAILRAVSANASAGEISQGGSTITQQLVKNLLLDTEQTLDRKVTEAALAWQFERRYTKDRILELYLNTIYFGNGAYGVSAAAEEYFGHPVEQLTLAESALLAGLIQAPAVYDPYAQPDPAIVRRNIVLDAMLEQDFISDVDHAAAVAEPLVLAPEVPVLDERYPAAHFVEEVKQFILHDPRFGDSPRERRQLLFTGGLRIHTTIDLGLQAMAEEAINNILPDPATQPSAALVAVDPATGYVRAMVGGRDYFGTGADAKYNLAMGKGRHTGSSFKPIVLAAAIEDGIGLDERFPAPGTIQLTYDNPPRIWDVGNYGEGGPGVPVSLWDATVSSYNTVYAQLILRVGVDRSIEMAHAMGITRPLDAFPSAVLGANDVQTLEMASVYGTLANRGVHVDPVLVTSIERADGTILYEAEHHQQRAMATETADEVTAVLQAVINGGTGSAAAIDRPAAGKTGTAQEWRNAWFCGYVPQLAAAVWVGFPGAVEVSMQPPVTPIRVTGGSYPARIWQRFMGAALAGIPAQEFVAPPTTTTTSRPSTTTTLATATTGAPQVVPNVVGQLRDNAISILQSRGYRVTIAERTTDAVSPGVVMSQAPGADTTLGTGGLVTIEVAVSRGPGNGNGNGGGNPN